MRRIWHSSHSTSNAPQDHHHLHHHPRKFSTRTLPKPPPPPPAPSPATPEPLQVAEKARRVELIIKLGGSALTVKSQPHTLHPSRFNHAIDSMARLHRRGLGFILVHGAGSFGHFEARHHAVSAGDASPIGMSATHAAVVKLNGLVVDALLKRGVPAVGVSPLLVPAKVRNDFVAALLDRGHLPVLHGDTCYAADGRTAILSGDALIATMASAFQFVNRIVFLSDVPGLLSRPPPCSNPPPEDLIKRITVNEAGDLHFDADLSTSTLEHDVTGGIAAKVMAAAKCVADGHGRITAFIAGVATEGAEHALMARPDRWGGASCTRITYQVQGVSTQEPYPQFDDAPSGRRRSWLFG